jgi:hypothetical protein
MYLAAPTPPDVACMARYSHTRFVYELVLMIDTVSGN